MSEKSKLTYIPLFHFVIDMHHYHVGGPTLGAPRQQVSTTCMLAYWFLEVNLSGMTSDLFLSTEEDDNSRASSR